MLARILASARRLVTPSRRGAPGQTLTAALLKTATAATLIWLGGDVGAAWGDGLRRLKEPQAPVFASAARVEPTAQGGLRLFLALSQPVETQIFTLEGPDRVVVDLPELGWGFDPKDVAAGAAPAARARGFEGLRAGLFRAGRSRLVLDLDAPLIPGQIRFSRGPGGAGAIMTLDLAAPEKRRAEAAQTLALAGEERLAQRPAAFAIETGSVGPAHGPAPLIAAPSPLLDLPPERELRLAPVPRPRPEAVTIVLDPGHGGHDPGARYGDIREGDLVLEVARELRDELQSAARVRVLMTRDSDRFIPLDRRVAIAREAKAALFVSIHADALPRHPEVSGTSFYTLADTASDALAERIARRENGVEGAAASPMADASPDLRQFLAGYFQRRSKAGSKSLVREMVANLRGAGVSMIQTNPHRQANLRVLRTFDQPSVLIELGFLTSLRDQRRFGNPAWRETAAKALAASILRWLRKREKPEGELVARTLVAAR